jgi:hypothetical protein
MSHRSLEPQHPILQIDINLDLTGSVVKPKLDALKPILADIIQYLHDYPISDAEDQQATANAGGYHNITFCSHL